MITFALTGGIGSGKTSVARIFSALGVAVIDADQLARAAVAPGTLALARIVELFGPQVLTATGELDRSKLGKIVFGDAAALGKLNALVHPVVQMLVTSEIERLSAEEAALACYDVPLLFETGQELKYRPVVVVVADDELRLERIMTRDGLARAAAQARLKSQMPLSDKARRADIVIANNGTWAELEREAELALNQVKAWPS